MSVNPFPLQLSLVKARKSPSIDDDDMNLQKRAGTAGAAASTAGAAAGATGAAATVAGGVGRGIGQALADEAINAGKKLLEGGGESKSPIPTVDLSTGTRVVPVTPDENTLRRPLSMTSDNMKNSFFAHSRYPRNPDLKKFLPALAAAAAPAVIGAIGEAMKPTADIPKVDLGDGQPPTAKSGDMKPKKPRVKTRSGTVIY